MTAVQRTPMPTAVPRLSTREVLAAAIDVALQAECVVPCRQDGGALWLSESAEERAEAARACIERHCPVLDECRAASQATRERFGVWAGVDRTPSAKRAAP